MQFVPQSPVANPFMLMLDPQRVLREMSRSTSLRALAQRTCHPLDRPMLRAISVELRHVDEQIDAGSDADDLGAAADAAAQ